MAWFDCVCIFVCVCAHTKRTWRKNPMFCFCPLCFIFYGSYVKNQIQVIDFGRILHIRIVVSFAEFRGTIKITFNISCIFFCFRCLFYLLSTSFLFHLATDHRMFLCHCMSVYILAFVVFNGVVVVVFAVCLFISLLTTLCCWNSCTGKNLTAKPVASLCRDSFSLFPSLSFSNTLDTTPTTVCVHSIHLIMNTLLI